MSQSPRVVLITGANSGVGLAATKVLITAAEEFHVIMTGRSLEKVLAAKNEISSSNPESASRLSTIQLDVTDSLSVEAAAKQVHETWGHLDALINNAAVGNIQSPDVRVRFQTCLETNVTGAAAVADAFRPLLLKASGKPYSIFVSSGAGSFSRTSARLFAPNTPNFPSPPNPTAYHASKAALNMVALFEHADYGNEIKVFAMSPGFVVSNLRGTTEELRSGWGLAGAPITAGETLLAILKGERDADVGRLIHKDGVYDW
ncbi:short chain dehydrogenase/reductase [Exophiala viscosa]|uniref:Short chain dehydrogenase/reductase n=1 Tax=Exophiala viscosa TaxID=2486360 RepID=A0AAN6E4W2_9EURO|nr:short chain dehydrogenase/reductase [Exophiala viscosa]